MPRFEITIQSQVGSIGPFYVHAVDGSAALLEGGRVAAEFLSGGLSRTLLQQTWVIVAQSESGEVVASVPFRIGDRQAASRDTGGR